MKSIIFILFLYNLLPADHSPVIPSATLSRSVDFCILEAGNRNSHAIGDRNFQTLNFSVFTWKLFSFKEQLVNYDQRTKRTRHLQFHEGLDLHDPNMVVPCNRDP